MSGDRSDETGVGRPNLGISNGQHCQLDETLVEWRSSEQVGNGVPSTSPPYWDSDDEYGGVKPSELYGKYTWKIEKFSHINKRELRSNAFDVGGYKWYILIYPQGCDVCNHLSLFLCVANYDKLLPGWSHFAQFTIAVVNKDPSKSKYSDTLHRFWKKEHDWGWKKFMELSKVSDGFLDSADTLIIKAQVQVIREKADRPFHCLDRQYRRELVRVYLTNVEQTCRIFMEERRGKLGELLDDKNRWSSFCTFWLAMDLHTRHCMSMERMDVILKVVVKHFFIEKDVSSTLVMDSLHSGLKALECQVKSSRKGKMKFLDAGEVPAPIVHVENDMFILVDDVLVLLERASLEPLPPKDEKGPQSRTKDENSGEEFDKDSIAHDERHLTELGRRTLEIFVLAHIFNHKIEAAYQEAIALRRQEELIREEEEACLAESEQKAKRGAIEKEKKSKKKQAKQKRNNRRGKERGREERSVVLLLDKHQEENESPRHEVNCMAEAVQEVDEKPDAFVDLSEGSDSPPDGAAEKCWDVDASETRSSLDATTGRGSSSSLPSYAAAEKHSTSANDDTSSTCSTDSLHSQLTNSPYGLNPNSSSYHEKLPCGGRNKLSKMRRKKNSAVEIDELPSVPTTYDAVKTRKTTTKSASSAAAAAAADALQDERNTAKKDSATNCLSDAYKASRSPPRTPQRFPPLGSAHNKSSAASQVTILAKRPPPPPTPHVIVSAGSAQSVSSAKTDADNSLMLKHPAKPHLQQTPSLSRPFTAPLVSGNRPPAAAAAAASIVQTSPVLTHGSSATSRFPLPYRDPVVASSPSSCSPGLAVNPPPLHGQLQPAAVFVPHAIQNPIQSGFPFGIQNGPPHWMDMPHKEANRTVMHHAEQPASAAANGHVQNRMMMLHGESRCGAGVVVTDEFPHLDIINDLLEDEQCVGGADMDSSRFKSVSVGPYPLSRQFSLSCSVGVSGDCWDLPAPSSSCRFERARSYGDVGFRLGCGSFVDRFNPVQEFVPQTGPHASRLVDGLAARHWQLPDFSSMGDAPLRHNPDRLNLACDINSYAMFPPSNGH